MKELEPQRARLRLQRTIEAHAQRLRSREVRHHLDVGHRRAGGEILAVGARQRRGKTVEELVAACLAERVDQGIPEIVVPAPRRQREPCLQLTDVECGNIAWRRAHGDHHARQHRLRQMHVEFRARPVERVVQDRLPLLAQLRRVVLARRVDEAHEETLEGIAPHEQPEPLPLAEVQDAHRRAQQLVLARLEQLVARIARENVEQRLAGVAAGRDPRPGNDVGRLAAQEWNIRRTGAVRGRGIQTEEAMLAAHIARCVEAFDADIIQIAGAVHGRARIGLGDDQEVGDPRVGADLRRQRREARRDLHGRVLAQEAEARAGDDLQRVLTVDHDQVVAAVGEEREVGVGEPGQEGLALGQLRPPATAADVRRSRRRQPAAGRASSPSRRPPSARRRAPAPRPAPARRDVPARSAGRPRRG